MLSFTAFAAASFEGSGCQECWKWVPPDGKGHQYCQNFCEEEERKEQERVEKQYDNPIGENHGCYIKQVSGIIPKGLKANGECRHYWDCASFNQCTTTMNGYIFFIKDTAKQTPQVGYQVEGIKPFIDSKSNMHDGCDGIWNPPAGTGEYLTNTLFIKPERIKRPRLRYFPPYHRTQGGITYIKDDAVWFGKLAHILHRTMHMSGRISINAEWGNVEFRVTSNTCK